MTDISVKEQKRLMLEARTTRIASDQTAVKPDLSDLETWLLKKIKVSSSKVIPTVSKPQPSIVSPSKGFRPSSPNNMKTLMSVEVCRADWEISSLICRSNHLMSSSSGATISMD